MAKSYSIREAAAPTNIGAVAVAGGSLAASTTYYYRIFGYGYSDYYKNINCWFSEPSAEITVATTVANKTILVHFDRIMGTSSVYAPCYGLFRTETSGVYNQTDASGNLTAKCARPTGRNSALYNTVATTTVAYRRYTFTSTGAIASLTPGEIITEQVSGATAQVLSDPAGGTTFYVWTLTGTWDGANPFDGSVTGVGAGTWSSTSAYNGFVLTDTTTTCSVFPFYEDGSPVLYLNGGTEEDPITLQDCYEYCQSVSRGELIEGIPLYSTGSYMTANGYDLCSMFKVNCALIDASGNWFKVQGGTAMSQANQKHYISTLVVGDVDAYGESSKGAAIVGNWHYAGYCGAAVFYLYGSTVGSQLVNSGIQNTNSDPRYQISTLLTGKDSFMRSTGRYISQTLLRNFRSTPGGETGTSLNVSDTENYKATSLINTSYSISQVTFNKFIMVEGASTTDMRCSNYSSPNLTEVIIANDCKTASGNDLVFSTGNSLVGATNWDAVCIENNTTTIKVVDEDGSAIEDAKVTIIDELGVPSTFNKDFQGKMNTSQNQGRTGTSITIGSGDLTVGEYYRHGLEVVYVSANPSGTTYTITRAQKGTTANYIRSSISLFNHFYLMYDYLETDANGEVETLLARRTFSDYDLNPSGLTGQSKVLTPVEKTHTITIEKAGYETYVSEYVADVTANMTITLKQALPVMTSTDSRVAVKMDARNIGVNRDKVIVV